MTTGHPPRRSSITSRRQQEAICSLARTLASFERDDELELEGAAVIEIDEKCSQSAAQRRNCMRDFS